MIYTKSKISNNKQNIKRHYIYEMSSKKTPSMSYKETNNLIKISDIYKYIYEDFFPKILSFKTKELFINEIEKNVLVILQNNFSNSELQTSFIKISIKKIKEEFLNKFNKDYSFLQESLINIKKNLKKINYVSHYRKHCSKTEDIACHLCDNGQYGKFIEIKSKFYLKKNDISYVICDKCNFCYEKNFIKMYCKKCGKNYYSEILKENENVNCLPATWENYHCGSRIKEIMKCLKCKHILYINLNNNKLVCLNKKCNFCIRPENIIWECYFCNTEFKSDAKIYNPLEFEIVKKAISRTVLYKNKAFPPYLLCCNGEITDKTKFYHKKECKGELYKGYLNNKEIVVCEKCHALNNFEKFCWLCPLCGQTFRIYDKIKNHKNNDNYDAKFDKINGISLSAHKNKSMNLAKNNTNSLVETKLESISKRNSKNDYSYNFSNNNIKSNNSKSSILKTGENTPSSIVNNFYFNFGFYIKRNKTNDISYERKKRIPHSKLNIVSEDFSLLHNKNISSINNTKQTEDNNKMIKVSKSIEQDVIHRKDSNLKKRRRETLHEILNNRKNTPNFCYRDRNDEKNPQIYYNKENDKKEDNKKVDKKSKTSFGFYSNKNNRSILVDKVFKNKSNLTSLGSIENFINDKKIIKKNITSKNNNNINNTNNVSNFSLRKILFDKGTKEKEKEEKEDNRNTIGHKTNSNFNRYINEFRKKRIISKSIDINNDKNNYTNNNYNQQNQISDNNYEFENRRKNILLEKPSKKNIESPVFKHNRSSLSNLIMKNYFNSNLLTAVVHEENHKKENVIEHKNNFDKFNRTAEYFRHKNYSIKKDLLNQQKIPSSNKGNNKILIRPIKSSVSSEYMYKDNKNKEKLGEKYIKRDIKLNIDNNNNNNSNYENKEKYVNKFILKKDKYKTKDNIKKNDDNIKKEKEEDKDDYKANNNEMILDNNLMDVISEDKIDNLSKNCPVPSFEEDDYIYVKPIGEGSFGRIFLVQDKRTKTQYALKKVICKDYQELIKFKKEFELLYSLNNNNIMKIYKLQIKSLDITTSCLYVLMEKGQSDWNQEIKKRAFIKKYYTESEIISILKQINSGLYFLQKNKVAHRDIKPQNILIFPKNVFKIADLGEAKNSAKNRIQMATLRGSELFMSPLLYNGLKYSKKNIRHNPFKSDVFSLGYCFLFAMCLHIRVLEDIREMNNMRNIKNSINKYVDKNRYSDKLLKIIYGMIELEEDKRFDFEQLEKEIKSKFY